MKINDKVIVAFLVSVGLFTTVQAVQYVRTLSMSERIGLVSAAKSSQGNVLLCEGVHDFVKTHEVG